MKYYYLNCAPERRQVIKRKLRSYLKSPYIILDSLDGCDEMLVIGPESPDMIQLERAAKKINMTISRIADEHLLEESVSRSREHAYELEY